MKKLLMTGASGLLGSYLVPLLRDSWELFALERPGSTPGVGVTPIAADLSERIDETVLPSRIDAVIHLAQSSRFRDFPDAAGDMFEVNLARLAELVSYARRAGSSHFIHASTGSVYHPSDFPLDEEAPTARAQAIGFYAATKLAAEMLAHSYSPWMAIVSLRYFFIYGRGQKRDRLVPWLIDSVRARSTIRLQGPDGLCLNPVHAVDAAAATAAALTVDESGIINVAGPETLSIRAMAQAIGDELGLQPIFEQSQGEAAHLIGDTSRMRQLLIAPERRFGSQLGELL